MTNLSLPFINVFVHTYDGPTLLENRVMAMVVLPRVGEYLALSSDGEWFCVDTIVHCPFNTSRDGAIDVELYAVKVAHMDVLKARKLE